MSRRNNRASTRSFSVACWLCRRNPWAKSPPARTRLAIDQLPEERSGQTGRTVRRASRRENGPEQARMPSPARPPQAGGTTCVGMTSSYVGVSRGVSWVEHLPCVGFSHYAVLAEQHAVDREPTRRRTAMLGRFRLFAVVSIHGVNVNTWLRPPLVFTEIRSNSWQFSQAQRL